MSEARAEQPARRLPGEEGVWVFVLGDLAIFSLFFCTFLFYRSPQLEVFEAGRQLLHLNLGLINTIALLSSSWFVVRGVQAAREQRASEAANLLSAALLLGAAFVAIKAVEYRDLIAAGHGLTSSDFFMFYFMFTGIHLVHVLVGLVVLYLLRDLCRRRLDASGVRALESGATYWHLVDLLWIVLFALLYLLP